MKKPNYFFVEAGTQKKYSNKGGFYFKIFPQKKVL